MNRSGMQHRPVLSGASEALQRKCCDIVKVARGAYGEDIMATFTQMKG